VLGGLQGSNPAWYGQLTGHLTEVQQKALTEVVTFADQRCAAKESKKIEQAGGYQFAQQTVPGGFNFGSDKDDCHKLMRENSSGSNKRCESAN